MTVIIVIKQSEVELSQLGGVSSYCATEYSVFDLEFRFIHANRLSQNFSNCADLLIKKCKKFNFSFFFIFTANADLLKFFGKCKDGKTRLVKVSIENGN